MDSSPQKESVDYNELLEKYQTLLSENDLLKEEIKGLNIQLGFEKNQIIDDVKTNQISEREKFAQNAQQIGITYSPINNQSDSKDKINLFMSLFKGRDDVFARRWENKMKETSGYSPACSNDAQWVK